MATFFQMTKIIFSCIFTLLLILNTAKSLSAQPFATTQKEAGMLVDLLQKCHIAPRIINDEFAKDVFDQLIKSTDPQHLYFSAKEIELLKKASLQIDEDIRFRKAAFITEFAKIFNKRLTQSETLIKVLLAQPVLFSKDEKIVSLINDSASFAKDEPAWNYKWNQRLKYQMLWHWVAQLDDKASKNNLIENDFFKSEPVFRNKVKITEQRKIRRILDNTAGSEKFISNAYLQSIAACYDPHTNYMSKIAYENFESVITTEALSLGLDLEEENGEISIARLVPGGSGWKSNELNKGDKIIEISWQGKEAVDLTGADVTEVEELINSSNTNTLELKVRKINGSTKVVTLAKEKLHEDESIVKSFVINGEKKIGYIYLPGFYTEVENSDAKGCANDVAKEIVKLKAEKIQGLILDIRNNGGGSLGEGLSLSGIFINEGPLFMMQVSKQKLQVMKDPNRGTIYDGPMVVMINGYSASASELLASTLQDYHRAILVGSRTYGKATGQTILPIDTNVSNLDNFSSPYGLVKVTMNRLFRITGKSAQLIGVQPDIALPDVYEALNQKETENDFALSRDTVTKKVIYTPLSPLPLNQLAEKSKQRLLLDSTFNKIKLSNAQNPILTKNIFQNIPLSPIPFKQKFLEIYNWYSSFEEIAYSGTANYTISKTKFDMPISKMSKYMQEIENIIIKNLQNDSYLSESCHILNDYINLISK